MKALLSVLIVIGTACCVLSQDEWPQFRGPTGQGIVHADLPLHWSATESITWRTEIPGEGHSSPVVSGSQIWLTTAVTTSLTEQQEKERLAEIPNSRGLKLAGPLTLQAIQVDRETGAIKQRIDLFAVKEPEPKHSLNSYASPTPVIVGPHVYCHFGTYGTACLDSSTGEVVWKTDDVKIDHQNGPGSSPVVWNDLVIIHFDGIDTQFLAAFDRMTGKIRWKTSRSGTMDPKPELQKAYCTPLIIGDDSKAVVVSPAANWVYGYDAATGKEIWKANYGKLGFSTVPRPVLEDNTVYLSTSYMQPRIVAVTLGGTGDVTETHVRWTSDKMAPRKPSMLVADGLLYSVADNGIAACFDVADGTEVWKARLTGDFSASPILANGRLYFFGQNGTTTVLQAGKELVELATNILPEGFMASPAVADSSLFLRTDKALYRIDQ